MLTFIILNLLCNFILKINDATFLYYIVLYIYSLHIYITKGNIIGDIRVKLPFLLSHLSRIIIIYIFSLFGYSSIALVSQYIAYFLL